MENSDEKKSRRTVSIPSLIGWLSLCVLAAAWGHTLDDQWQPIWAQLGAFGLVAAVALGRLEAARSARKRWKHFQAVQTRLERRVARFNEQSDTVETIHAGVRKLRQYAAEAHQRVKRSGRALRCSQAALCHMPLWVTPVEEHGVELHPNSVEKIHGSLDQISTRAVAFDHAQAFATDLVLLGFQLAPGERLSFVVDVIWSKHNKDGSGFTSGGTVLAVGVPDEDADDSRENTAQESAAPAGAL
jgi:hypothetical protein